MDQIILLICSFLYCQTIINVRNFSVLGMIVIDSSGNMAAGTSTNGASYKVPG